MSDSSAQVRSPDADRTEPAWLAPPRSLYVHVPFCHRRCGYCNFTLMAGRDDLIEPYLRAVSIELSSLAYAANIDTRYFGGGTPTRLNAQQMSVLAAAVQQQFPLAAGAEWTVEANPADIDADYTRCLADLGVNRLSLGGQSFSAPKLHWLDRDHSPQQLATAAEIAARHIGAVSLDLIFGVPGETLDAWRADLQRALDLRPVHLSLYGLTYERGARIWALRNRGLLQPVPEESEREMYLLAIDMLTAAGYEHYEVSNFALPGHRCRHNEVYWSARAYHAVGPGASSFVDGCRRTNHGSTSTYLKRVLSGASPVAEIDELPAAQRAAEVLVFGLRRLEGWRRDDFFRSTGYSLDALAGAVLERYVAEGWLQDDGQCICLTRAGLLISDALWPDLLI